MTRNPRPGTPLTRIEREVLHLMSHGNSDAEIAVKLIRSAQTIKTHVRRLSVRLKANGRPHAVRRGFELGYLRDESS